METGIERLEEIGLRLRIPSLPTPTTVGGAPYLLPVGGKCSATGGVGLQPVVVCQDLKGVTWRERAVRGGQDVGVVPGLDRNRIPECHRARRRGELDVVPDELERADLRRATSAPLRESGESFCNGSSASSHGELDLSLAPASLGSIALKVPEARHASVRLHDGVLLDRCECDRIPEAILSGGLAGADPLVEAQQVSERIRHRSHLGGADLARARSAGPPGSL